MTSITSPYKVIGSRPLRPDGVDKVTGRAIYGADVKLPGMLHGKVLRSPHAHARIVTLDASAALALRGVRAVATAQDMPAIGDKIADLGESTVNLRYIATTFWRTTRCSTTATPSPRSLPTMYISPKRRWR
jgi:xanthine dehydrogenase molybdenum-binding subunit